LGVALPLPPETRYWDAPSDATAGDSERADGSAREREPLTTEDTVERREDRPLRGEDAGLPLAGGIWGPESMMTEGVVEEREDRPLGDRERGSAVSCPALLGGTRTAPGEETAL
jgi:hypothetical protein